jgi:hypothetical protein
MNVEGLPCPVAQQLPRVKEEPELGVGTRETMIPAVYLRGNQGGSGAAAIASAGIDHAE